MTEEEGVTDSEDVVTGGRNLLSVPAPGGDGEEGAALRVGDFGGTMADFFEIGGLGQGALGLNRRAAPLCICRDVVAGLKDCQQGYLECRLMGCLANHLSWMQSICKMKLAC